MWFRRFVSRIGLWSVDVASNLFEFDYFVDRGTRGLASNRDAAPNRAHIAYPLGDSETPATRKATLE